MNRKFNAILLTVFVLAMPMRALSQGDSIVSYSDDLVIAGPASLRADGGRLAEDSLKRWDFHLAMGATMVGGRHLSASGFALTPTVVFRPNERLKISASMSMLDSYSLYPGGYNLGAREVRSLAPVRNAGAAAAAVSVAASYKVNDRLWIAASLMNVSGGVASAALVNPWLTGVGPVMLDATAFSAAMRYKVGESSFLDLHLTVIDDRMGTLGPLYFGGPFGGYYADPLFGPFGGHTTMINALVR